MINTDFAIRSFKGGYDDNFQYLLTCLQSRAQVSIDAALPLDTIRPFIDGAFVAMLITHTHGDHIAFIDEYLDAFPELLIIINECSDRKSTRLNSSHALISYAVFCLKKKKRHNLVCRLLWNQYFLLLIVY